MKENNSERTSREIAMEAMEELSSMKPAVTKKNVPYSAVITVILLNVREAPTYRAKVTSFYKKGTEVTIYEEVADPTVPDASWGKTDIGWVNLDCVARV